MTSNRSRNPLSTTGLDRLGLLRKHPERLRRYLVDADVRLVPLCGGRVCVDGDAIVLAPRDSSGPDALLDDAWLLGEAAGTVFLATDYSEDQWERLVLPRGARLAGLREVASMLAPLEGNLLATAAGLAAWHATHRFCGRCGAETSVDWAGHRRLCGHCGREHFPRTDPAIIVRVTHDDRVLLARNPAWPAGFASVLAGFVEPGEALEDAVVREVKEEAGVALDPDSVTYHSSQPWPFPSSLMIGFSAAATGDELAPDPDELVDERWYSREDLEDGAVSLPPPLSISRRLIDEWIAESSPPVRPSV